MIKAVIMAGGQGTRFWPLSRQDRPKQFLRIAGERSMLQETVARLEPAVSPSDVYIVSSARYLEEVRRQLPQLEESQIIVEPAPRNTAPAIGLAAVRLQREFPEAAMAVFPSDHVIRDVEEFHQTLLSAEAAARDGWLVTFGIEPDYPSPAYGYIQAGEKLGEYAGKEVFRALRFTEKPEVETARRFLSDGTYYWNSGMFVWTLEAILFEINRLMPESYRSLQEIDEHWGDSKRVSEAFSRIEKTSIDFGIMEQSSRVACIPARLGWNDVGSWRALGEVRAVDSRAVAANRRYLSIDSRDCILYSEKEKLIAIVGVEGLVVVDTDDALLVCSKERSEEVKKAVERLRQEGLERYL